MTSVAEKVRAFRALHRKGAAFIIANPWDAGSARILEGIGCKALASTSSGFAMTLGRKDYSVARAEAIAHGAALAAAVDIPVSADLENGFGTRPEDAAETIRLAAMTGLAGGSIEDSSGDKSHPIIEESLAVERVAAAVEAARAAKDGFVLTARAESFLHGGTDLGAVIRRLQAFEKAGAEVLFAPGLPDMAAVKAVCDAVSTPVNVLVLFGLRKHTVSEFAAAGAARLSIGGGFAWSAYGTLANAAAMLEDGGFAFLDTHPERAKIIGKHLRSY